MLARTLSVFLACSPTLACKDVPEPPEVRGPRPPYPDQAKEQGEPELGWQTGGCPFMHAANTFGAVAAAPSDAPRSTSLACLVEALKPDRASDSTLFAPNGDGDVPDLVVGASFADGPLLARLGPNDTSRAWFVFAPANLRDGDRVAFAAMDRDVGSADDILGDASMVFASGKPIVAVSDDLRVNCTVIARDRLAAALAPIAATATSELEIFERAAPIWDPPGQGRPEAAHRAADALRCMSALAGPEATTLEVLLQRLASAKTRWTDLVRALVQAQLPKDAKMHGPNKLAEAPANATLTAATCGAARLPDDTRWGISSNNEALGAATWCLAPLRLDNLAATPLTFALVTSPTRAEHADTIGFGHWTALYDDGTSATCPVRHGDSGQVAAGATLETLIACERPAGRTIAALRIDYRVGPGDTWRPLALPW